MVQNLGKHGWSLFERVLYETVAEAKIRAAESDLPPSGQCGDRKGETA